MKPRRMSRLPTQAGIKCFSLCAEPSLLIVFPHQGRQAAPAGA
jgi:hypothetical protein